MGTLLGTSASLGCGSNASSPPPATATSATTTANDEAADGLMEHHRHHHHGGVTLFIAMSLDTLGSAPETKAKVESIRTDLHAKMEPARIAEQNLSTMLADGIAAGNLDAAKVDAGVQALVTATATVQEASVDALNQLHAVLTPTERTALADKVEAHWAVWQKANAEEAADAKPEGGHLALLASELELTPDQVDKIRASLAEGMKSVPHFDPQEVTTYVRALSDAFRADAFDAKTLTAAHDASAHMAGWGAAHRARFLEAVGPVLTPDQRTKLADKLREHASHNPSAQGA